MGIYEGFFINIFFIFRVKGVFIGFSIKIYGIVLSSPKFFTNTLNSVRPNYSQENTSIILDKLREGQTKKIIENSNVVEITKKNGQITRKPLIKNWTDWIDYWSVDFDYESKIEVVKTNTDGKETFQHTGNYIFENEWQDFIYRTKGEDKIMTKTHYYQIRKKNIKIAIRVIDIFANDTMIIKEINK